MRSLVLLAASLVTLAPAQAAVLWTFSYDSGGEAGSFQTNGTFADTAGSFNFVIDTNTFTMTSSTFAPALVGATFNAGAQPTIGFLWNGTIATQFYRSSGVLTNGSNVFPTVGLYRITLYSDGTSMLAATQDPGNATTTGFVALTLTPQSATATPEPSTFAAAALALIGLAAVKRRYPRSTTPASRQ